MFRPFFPSSSPARHRSPPPPLHCLRTFSVDDALWRSTAYIHNDNLGPGLGGAWFGSCTHATYDSTPACYAAAAIPVTYFWCEYEDYRLVLRAASCREAPYLCFPIFMLVAPFLLPRPAPPSPTTHYTPTTRCRHHHHHRRLHSSSNNNTSTRPSPQHNSNTTLHSLPQHRQCSGRCARNRPRRRLQPIDARASGGRWSA
ncbi:hypothetical protein EDC01DRAFT_356802 [Geopyxis carbonaria]|nr:hypothetical protein EDC01DRAFT_356802 [Geopyxis carbonaria]